MDEYRQILFEKVFKRPRYGSLNVDDNRSHSPAVLRYFTDLSGSDVHFFVNKCDIFGSELNDIFEKKEKLQCKITKSQISKQTVDTLQFKETDMDRLNTVLESVIGYCQDLKTKFAIFMWNSSRVLVVLALLHYI